MQNSQKAALTLDTPVIFADGSKVYDKLAKEFVRHDKGLFILAPSGAGKTYFVNHQLKKDWVDGDNLWAITNADPTGDEWDSDIDLIQEVNDRCDVITNQAKKLGFWVMGSSNRYLKPDAIVIPPWEEHIKMVTHREHAAYDGGATSENLKELRAHCEWIAHWEAEGVPRFDSISLAVSFLTK